MKLIALTAPSGAGKTTIAQRVMQAIPDLRFSVSATTRPKREDEVEGVDYVFLHVDEFKNRTEAGEFIEFEEVYPGRFYGTPRKEIEKLAQDTPLLLDLDVKGAINVKKFYGKNVLTIFIKPPSLEALENRLRARGTETEELIAIRLERAVLELGYANRFDVVIVNDDLDTAVKETEEAIRTFLIG
ncbi:MAG: guanylate kinase [Rubricoccaceae bacterium]|nr:guanylate kinase [Rubricoccaceae bacterium]